MEPWRCACAGTIGQWKMSTTEIIKNKKGRGKKIHTNVATACALIMIDEAASQSKITRVSDKKSFETARYFIESGCSDTHARL